jgi:hypothetical protein
MFRSKRIVLGLLVIVSGLLAAGWALAQQRRPVGWRPRADFSVALEDHEGQILRTFQHGGATWVLGNDGQRFAVRVRNNTDRRVEAVISVDGRDAVTGAQGDFVRQRGYLVPAFGSVLVEGFRTSLDEVASFRFTSPEGSYSARMGTPENVGVIGVAFFAERQRDVEIAERRAERAQKRAARGRASGAAPAPKASAAPRDAARADESNLGTQWGEQRVSRVSEVAFQRENPSAPTRIVTLRYDDAEGLSARGIRVFDELRQVRAGGPEPFPARRFAQPAP